jgi:hypothetical protein
MNSGYPGNGKSVTSKKNDPIIVSGIIAMNPARKATKYFVLVTFDMTGTIFSSIHVVKFFIVLNSFFIKRLQKKYSSFFIFLLFLNLEYIPNKKELTISSQFFFYYYNDLNASTTFSTVNP